MPSGLAHDEGSQGVHVRQPLARDLADDPDQHKHLHVVKLKGGLIGAFPNHRVMMPDLAFWPTMDGKPDFESLDGEFRSEGNQHLLRPSHSTVATPESALNGSAAQH